VRAALSFFATFLSILQECGSNSWSIIGIYMKTTEKITSIKCEGDTDLHCAVRACDINLVMDVLKQGIVDINKENSHEETALLISVRENKSQKIAVLLLENNANQYKVPYGLPHMYYIFDKACENGWGDVVYRLFLKMPIFDDRYDKTDYRKMAVDRCLYIATEYNHLSLVEWALELKASVNMSSNGTGKTPLHIAMEQGNTQIAQKLLSCAADSTKIDNSSKTPLDSLIKNSKLEQSTKIEAMLMFSTHLLKVEKVEKNTGCADEFCKAFKWLEKAHVDITTLFLDANVIGVDTN
jgi:ankyrin repeat protein